MFIFFEIPPPLPLSVALTSDFRERGLRAGGLRFFSPTTMAFRSSVILSVIFYLFIISRASHVTTQFKGIDLASPALDVTPTPISGHSSVLGSKDVLLCDRVQVSGLSRLNLGSYASTFRVTLTPSVLIPERLHNRIQVCFHQNASLGLCKCENDDWKAVQKGVWHTVMSPYDDRYIDVKFIGDIPGFITVAVEEDFQQWRLLFLALGFLLLLLAPFISSWVPFYYSSSMAIGIFLIVIIILFQGMKLLPTGRKNILYLTLYGSVLGAGSFLLHQLSVLVNSILVSFGLNEEMHNPVAIFVVVGIILSGAALGYWIVRKFVISKNGSVDVGVAQFVKWAMRIIATTFIFQSTVDTQLAMAALASCSGIYYLITPAKRNCLMLRPYTMDRNTWLDQSKQGTKMHRRAEFLSRSPRMDSNRKVWNSPRSSPAWINSPVKGMVSSPLIAAAEDHQDYYSTFHKTPNRKKFTKQEWEDFTRESTRYAMAELTASPEFTDWMIEHTDKLKLVPSDSSDESVGSKSSSIDDDDAEERHSGFRLFSW